MKVLTIVRHAKSSWGNFELGDHERPLKEIGIIKTQKVIGYLQKVKLVPQLIISSTATRALETAKLLAQGVGYDENRIQIERAIYHAGADDIYNEVFSVDSSIDSLMVVGHNPTLTDFVNNFVEPQIDNLPTSGTVCIEFDTDTWQNIVDAKFKVKFAVFPKMLQ